MTSTAPEALCSICQKQRITYTCRGCSNEFCLEDLTQHHQSLGKELNEIENDYNEFKQVLDNKKDDSEKHPLIQEIDKWKDESINKIKQTAEECRQQLINCTKKPIIKIEKQLNDFAQKLQEVRGKNEVNEIIISTFKENLNKLQKELNKPSNISTEKESSRFINKISVIMSSEKVNKILFKRPVRIP